MVFQLAWESATWRKGGELWRKGKETKILRESILRKETDRRKEVKLFWII